MTIAFTDAYRQQRHISASGTGTEGDPYTKRMELVNGLTEAQVQSAVALAVANLSQLTSSEIESAVAAAIGGLGLHIPVNTLGSREVGTK